MSAKEQRRVDAFIAQVYVFAARELSAQEERLHNVRRIDAKRIQQGREDRRQLVATLTAWEERHGKT